ANRAVEVAQLGSRVDGQCEHIADIGLKRAAPPLPQLDRPFQIRQSLSELVMANVLLAEVVVGKRFVRIFFERKREQMKVAVHFALDALRLGNVSPVANPDAILKDQIGIGSIVGTQQVLVDASVEARTHMVWEQPPLPDLVAKVTLAV